jgi:hypothetical protein
MVRAGGEVKLKQAKVRALRNDSWLGIQKGKEYTGRYIQNILFVDTDGYTVVFNKVDFEHVGEI